MDKEGTVGYRLKALRLEAGLTQNELAEKVGISKTAIFQYETNKRKPNFEALVKMQDFFRVPMDYLMATSNIKSTGKYYFEDTSKYFNLEDIKKNIEEHNDIELINALYSMSGQHMEILLGLNISSYVDKLYIFTVINDLIDLLLSDIYWKSKQGNSDFIECFSLCKYKIEKLFLDLLNKKSRLLLDGNFDQIIFKEDILKYVPLSFDQVMNNEKK